MRPGQAFTNPHLAALAADGGLRIAVPAAMGGLGGSMADLFEAVVRTARHSVAAARIQAAQRHCMEVLLAGENIGLAEYRLPSLLEGSISGACSATWPDRPLAPLTFTEASTGGFLEGRLHPLPNVGAHWYLVTALLRLHPLRAPGIVLLSSEQDGLRRGPGDDGQAVDGDDCAALTASGVYCRGDEVLHEDATQIAGPLRRFAFFLRGAIAAGAALRTLEDLPAVRRNGVKASLTRTVDTVLRAVAGASRLPQDPQLAAACAWLAALHAAERGRSLAP